MIAHVVGPHDGGTCRIGAFFAKGELRDLFGLAEGGENKHQIGNEGLCLGMDGGRLLSLGGALQTKWAIGYGEFFEQGTVNGLCLLNATKGGFCLLIDVLDDQMLMAVGNSEGIKRKVSEEGVLSGNFITGCKGVNNGGKGTIHGHPITG